MIPCITDERKSARAKAVQVSLIIGLALATFALASGTAGAVKTVNSCQEINATNAPNDGIVELGADLTASGDCIEINTSDIIFDGQANTLLGSGGGYRNRGERNQRWRWSDQRHGA